MRRLLPVLAALALSLAGLAWWSTGEFEDDAFLPPAAAPRIEEPRAPPPHPLVVEPERMPAPVDAGRPPEPSESPDASMSDDAGAEPAAPEPDAGRADAGPLLTPEALVLDAGTPKSANDPRFGVRWGQEGLCGDEPLRRLAQRRADLLASFSAVRRAGTQVFSAPGVPVAFIDEVGRSISEARVIATRLLGLQADVQLPVIYVYESAEQMRDVACVNTATQGYYDGAIHLPATDPDAWRTVVHEHMHHVLNALGLKKPMWFHEGLAMYAADERWWEDPRLGLVAWLRGAHLPFPALTEAFPHTADELFASAAYYQSYTMVSFLGARARRSDFAWFVEGVVAGTINPQTSFSDATGLSGDQLEATWRAYVLSR